MNNSSTSVVRLQVLHLTVIGALLLIAVSASCTAERPDEQARTEVGPILAESRPKTVRLVDAIQNHNRAPSIVGEKGGYEPIFGKEYDWAEQDRVLNAIETLSTHAEEAWPDLVAHLDDNRYCVTYEVFKSAQNFTVGETCREIISNCLAEAYIDELPDGSEMVFHYLYTPDVVLREDFKSWCQERSNRQLYELQIEMCEWAIKRLPEVPEVSTEDCRRSIKLIESQIQSLRKEKKAARVESFAGTGREIRTVYDREWAESLREGKQRPSTHRERKIKPKSVGEGAPREGPPNPFLFLQDGDAKQAPDKEATTKRGNH